MSVRSLRYNTIEQHFTKSALASTDRDALAFLEAAQIYNTNQQRAIVNLVRSLKRVGLWSKMKAIYPFIGGTATSHKWNLKDPRDVDAAFRLTFSGGWTHSSTGADPNGTNAWANTFLAQNSLSLNSTHLSVYLRQDINTTTIDIGVINNVGTDRESCYLISRFPNPSSNAYAVINHSNGLAGANPSITTSLGFTIGNRSNSTEQKIYRNTSLLLTQTRSSNILCNLNLYIGAVNLTGNADYFSGRQTAFATIGDGLTDSEASALYNIVDLYQKRLGRAV